MFLLATTINGLRVNIYVDSVTEKQRVESILLDLGISWVSARYVSKEKTVPTTIQPAPTTP